MYIEKSFQAIDTHTGGEPTRIVVSGLPTLRGKSVMEKKQDMEARYDWIRRALNYEPRGHLNMFGAFLVEPSCPQADFGVIFSDSGSYLNMCGHGTIGVATMLVEMGYVPKVEPCTKLVLEAPAGLIAAQAAVAQGRVESVTYTNVPSFVYKQNCAVTLAETGEVVFDIVFGGSFFALVHASQLKLDLCHENLSAIVPLALRLRDCINKNIQVQHPSLPISIVDIIEIYDDSARSGVHSKNAVVFGEGNADRSPCGTGTSVRLALLYEQGKIGLGETFVNESLLGSRFTGKVVEETAVHDKKAVITQVTGSAYITGINQLIIDERDPYKYGFL